VQVKFNHKPVISLAGEETKALCANSGKVLLTHTPSAKANGADVPWKITFDTGTSGVICPDLLSTSGE
jgi:hypothetical protein